MDTAPRPSRSWLVFPTCVPSLFRYNAYIGLKSSSLYTWSIKRPHDNSKALHIRVVREDRRARFRSELRVWVARRRKPSGHARLGVCIRRERGRGRGTTGCPPPRRGPRHLLPHPPKTRSRVTLNETGRGPHPVSSSSRLLSVAIARWQTRAFFEEGVREKERFLET